MEQFWHELVSQWPDLNAFLRVTFRVAFAAIVGALPGLEREHLHVSAGLRTHILVSVGACLFVLASIESGASAADTSRVIQGLATGIGFVGAGAILKWSDTHRVQGLTTAASIWLTAALGSAVGMGRIWLPLWGSALALFVLSCMRRFESHPVDKPGA